MDESLSTRWFDPLFKAEAMRRVFSDRGRLQGILDFQGALAGGQARGGVISASAANSIQSQCRAELFDIGELSQATATAGNPAIPIIQELTRRVHDLSPEAARYVHWSATSQDAMDTGLVLQIRQALDLIDEEIAEVCRRLAALAHKHRATPMVGRTWLQQAAPTTFGLKVAGWLSALTRHQARLKPLRTRCLVLQLGSAVGTLATLGEQASEVAALVADELKLEVPDLPWHAHRDRLAEIAVTLGLVVGTLGKMARDVSLMSQSEVAEVAEPTEPGRGGSSSMPQKQNPVGCAAVLAAALRVPPLVATMLAAMPQEHERGLGTWQAEWETLPEIFLLSAGALAHMRDIAAGLVVDPVRMRANLEAAGGLIYAEALSAALAQRIGRTAAHTLTKRACRRAADEGRPLQEIVAGEPEITAHLSAAERQNLFDLQPHIRSAARLVDRALAAAARVKVGNQSHKEGQSR